MRFGSASALSPRCSPASPEAWAHGGAGVRPVLGPLPPALAGNADRAARDARARSSCSRTRRRAPSRCSTKSACPSCASARAASRPTSPPRPGTARWDPRAWCPPPPTRPTPNRAGCARAPLCRMAGSTRVWSRRSSRPITGAQGNGRVRALGGAAARERREVDAGRALPAPRRRPPAATAPVSPRPRRSFPVCASRSARPRAGAAGPQRDRRPASRVRRGWRALSADRPGGRRCEPAQPPPGSAARAARARRRTRHGTATRAPAAPSGARGLFAALRMDRAARVGDYRTAAWPAARSATCSSGASRCSSAISPCA